MAKKKDAGPSAAPQKTTAVTVAQTVVAEDGKKHEKYVPEKETWVYRCIRTCYWDGHLHNGTDRVQKSSQAAIVKFVGPTTIPQSFQFSNWERIE